MVGRNAQLEGEGLMVQSIIEEITGNMVNRIDRPGKRAALFPSYLEIPECFALTRENSPPVIVNFGWKRSKTARCRPATCLRSW